MHLTKEDIQRFKTICEAEFNEEFERVEAERMAHDVISVYEAIWEHKKQTTANQCCCCPVHTDQPTT